MDTANKMITAKELYWGDNGIHEFWESEDKELLVFRNHNESFWTAHRNHGFLFGSQSAHTAATRLNVILSPARKWKQKGKAFVLEFAAATQEVA